MIEPIDPVAIGRRLRERREELNMSQAKLGYELRRAGFRGFSQQNIVSLEQGKIKDPRQKINDLADTLQTTFDWLIYERGPKQAGPPVMTPEEYGSLSLEMRRELSAIVMARQAKSKSA